LPHLLLGDLALLPSYLSRHNGWGDLASVYVALELLGRVELLLALRLLRLRLGLNLAPGGV
jgi:hypothetical protein